MGIDRGDWKLPSRLRNGETPFSVKLSNYSPKGRCQTLSSSVFSYLQGQAANCSGLCPPVRCWKGWSCQGQMPRLAGVPFWGRRSWKFLVKSFPSLASVVEVHWETSFVALPAPWINSSWWLLPSDQLWLLQLFDKCNLFWHQSFGSVCDFHIINIFFFFPL